MTSFLDHLTEDLRLCILRVLNDLPGNRANASILQDAVNALGHHATREQVEQALSYLEGLQALAVEKVGTVTVATLRANGQNHLKRLGAPLPGVKLPSLG